MKPLQIYDQLSASHRHDLTSLPMMISRGHSRETISVKGPI